MLNVALRVTKKLVSVGLLLILRVASAQAVINGSSVLQPIDGFGGENGGPWSWASTPYNWNCMDSTTATNLFSPSSGIGVSIYRSDNQDGTSSTLPPDMCSMKLAWAQGAQIQYTVASPPSSMKLSGIFETGTMNNSGAQAGTCLSSSTSLASYASYIVQQIQNIQSNGGLTVTWVDLQNEPNGGNSTTGSGFGACSYNAQGIDNMVQALASALSTAGLSTKILIPSVYNYGNAPSYFGTCTGDSSCKSHISVLSGHGYGYPDTPIAPGSGGWPALSAGYHLWEGETCPNSETSFDPNMDSALEMAQNIQGFLQTAQVSSYNWWELGYISQGGGEQDCSLIGTPSSGANVYAKRFYAFGNWSKFIRPGWNEISATQAPQSGVTVTAFKSNSSFAIVTVNSNSGSVSQSFSLSGLSTSSVTPYITDASNNLVQQSALTVSGNAFTATLTPTSVTTFVALASYPLTVATTGTGSGLISGTNCTSGTYVSGTSVSCTATANSGSTFVGWSGSCSGITNPCAFTLNAAASVTAQFNTNSGSTINAASCSQADVQTACNSLTASTTVLNIPACSGGATWTSTVTCTIPNGNSGITIQGQTTVSGRGNPGGSTNGVLTPTDNTVIIDGMTYGGGDPPLWSIVGSGGPLRLTGITITGSGALQTYNGALTFSGASSKFEMDHIHIVNLYENIGNVPSSTYVGVIDHVLFDQSSSGHGGIAFHVTGATGSDFGGNAPWSQATALGSLSTIDFEDNEFINDGEDCDRGGRFTLRYNNDVGPQGQYVLVHPTGEPGGAIRGCREWEVYGNKWANAPGNTTHTSQAWFLTSGTGVSFQNSATDGFTDSFFALYSIRTTNATYTQTATPNGWGYCGTNFNGTGSAWDQNQNTQYGYRCLDQPGTGLNTCNPIVPNGNFPTLTPVWPCQNHEPMYEWMDQFVPGFGQFVVNETPNNLFNNNDYYLWCNPSSPTGCTTYNGTQGVGSGILAARPATCTTGVGYWATDQGNWNTSGIGGQGELFICSATNTWTLSYTPPAYPNPIVGGGTTTYMLTANTSGSGSGSLSGTNCTTGNYASGTSVSCTPSANPGSSFTTWSAGPCNGTSTIPCNFTLSAATTITSGFSLNSYTLSVSTTGSGSGTVSGSNCTSGTYTYGTTVSCAANPSAGSGFTGWSGGTCSGSTTPCNFTVTGNATVVATFTLGVYTLTVNSAGSGRGTISGTNCTSGSYAFNTAISCTATPTAGSTFTGWSGLCSGVGSCNFNLTASGSVTATFVIPQAPVGFTGNVTLTGGGSIQ